MIGLDTNVLVRYLVRDDPAQTAAADQVIEGAADAGTPLYLSGIVLCEVVWVLERAYLRPRRDVAAALDAILRTAHFRLDAPARCRQALDAYRRGPGDFADHLLGYEGADAGCTTTVTFDRVLAGSPLFRVL